MAAALTTCAALSTTARSKTAWAIGTLATAGLARTRRASRATVATSRCIATLTATTLPGTLPLPAKPASRNARVLGGVDRPAPTSQGSEDSDSGDDRTGIGHERTPCRWAVLIAQYGTCAA